MRWYGPVARCGVTQANQRRFMSAKLRLGLPWRRRIFVPSVSLSDHGANVQTPLQSRSANSPPIKESSSAPPLAPPTGRRIRHVLRQLLLQLRHLPLRFLRLRKKAVRHLCDAAQGGHANHEIMHVVRLARTGARCTLCGQRVNGAVEGSAKRGRRGRGSLNRAAQLRAATRSQGTQRGDRGGPHARVRCDAVPPAER